MKCYFCGDEIHGSFQLLNQKDPICFGCAIGIFEDPNFDVALKEIGGSDEDQ
jgi:hypothetical protein